MWRVVWLLPEPVRTAQIAIDRLRRLQLGRARPHQPVVGAGGQDARADVHHVLVRDVGVGEDDLVGLLAGDHVLELLLGDDRDAAS